MEGRGGGGAAGGPWRRREGREVISPFWGGHCPLSSAETATAETHGGAGSSTAGENSALVLCTTQHPLLSLS